MTEDLGDKIGFYSLAGNLWEIRKEGGKLVTHNEYGRGRLNASVIYSNAIKLNKSELELRKASLQKKISFIDGTLFSDPAQTSAKCTSGYDADHTDHEHPTDLDHL
ncbi:hypothetical protein BMS3Abin17_01041 [archaeon BMS3Abin17]|nr:hypothetical protein BMS3Abin17_01041 [archaeon BMS3Abin17]HDZ60683.1 hypothetical protein [Candidatus Pacearchaeota archaeon]